MGITNQISQALAAIFTAQTGIAITYLDLPSYPYSGKKPFASFAPFHDRQDPYLSGSVSDSESNPSTWIMHYIIDPSVKASLDRQAAGVKMRDDMDLFKAGFARKQNVDLGGLVETAGNAILVVYHPDGPYVKVAQNVSLGCYALISIVHLPTPFGCNP